MIRLFETQHSTGVLTSTQKRLLGAFLALLGLSGSHWLAYKTGVTHGNIEGIDFIHGMCYNNGGLVINERGEAVVCSPLVKIPREELGLLQRRLDKLPQA